MEVSPCFDILQLYENYLFIRQNLEKDENIHFSHTIKKINRYGFQQKRVMMITSK